MHITKEFTHTISPENNLEQLKQEILTKDPNFSLSILNMLSMKRMKLEESHWMIFGS